ncbi:hypothetical protein RF55_15751 [Lasius niger]|uniref:Uncharacterized protein n=1 Tax=Lasius niger TaxID=67767 RepID=A0A0J7K5J3_LASNI|nr:hypothetical protein RF55_15751 [Lasius niger]
MELLIAAQRELYGRINRTFENLRKAGSAKSVALVQSALAILEGKWTKFEDQHDRLLLEFGDTLQGNNYASSDLVSTVEMVSLVGPSGDIEQRSLRSESAPSRSVLPRIQLPQFSGKFEDWLAFRDLFSLSLSRRPPCQKSKFHYLKTSVKEDAEHLIQNLPSTEVNFERAWSTLKDHFENKRLLVRSYLAAFTSLPRMKADSVADLRRIFHGMVSTVGALEGIGRPISNGNDLLEHLVVASRRQNPP